MTTPPQYFMPDGMPSAPGLPFADNPEDGVYHPAGGGFGIAVNGLRAVEVDNDGNIRLLTVDASVFDSNGDPIGGGTSLTGWETDEDGVLVGSINGEPRFQFADDGTVAGDPPPVGAAFRQFVIQDSNQGAGGTAYIEARDESELVLNPYARLSWGYANNDDQDGFVEIEVSDADNALATVLRADTEGTDIYGTLSESGQVNLHSNAGVKLKGKPGVLFNWWVNEIGVFGPVGPADGLCLPVKAGAFSDADYDYGMSGMVGVDTTGERLMVRVGEAWFYVDLTAV